LAERYCQDLEDRKLITPMTYDPNGSDVGSSMLEVAGMYGEYVSSDDFKALAQRFLLAMELIHEMETEIGDDPLF